MTDIDALTVEQLAATWTSDHNKHLEDDTTHPEVTRAARAMLTRYVDLRGPDIEAQLRAMGAEKRKELRHSLARRLRSSRTLEERATVLLLPQVENAEAEIPALPEGRELAAKVAALGAAISKLKGKPYKLKIRDGIRPT